MISSWWVWINVAKSSHERLNNVYMLCANYIKLYPSTYVMYLCRISFHAHWNCALLNITRIMRDIIIYLYWDYCILPHNWTVSYLRHRVRFNISYIIRVNDVVHLDVYCSIINYLCNKDLYNIRHSFLTSLV